MPDVRYPDKTALASGEELLFGTPAATPEQALHNLHMSQERLRRTAAETDGRDADLDAQFHDVVSGLQAEVVDWSDINSWPSPEQIKNTWRTNRDSRVDPQATPAGPKPASRDPRARMLELLVQAGPHGSSPKVLADLLNQEGFPTVRQTVADWLSDELKNGTVIRPKTGLYIHQGTQSGGDSES